MPSFFPVSRRAWIRVCALCGGLVLACGKQVEAPPAPSGPIVNVLDLAISLRSGSPAPAQAHEVELAAAALNVAGQTVLALTDGQFAEADRPGGELPKLKAALTKQPHPRLSLSVSSSIPYSSAALVLSTAAAAGVRSVAFKVRPPGASSTTGFLTLEEPSYRPKSKNDEPVEIPGSAPKPWSEFAAKWELVQSACRTSQTGNCAYKPELIAEGGVLKIVLYAAGQGANVAFYRIGEPPPPPKPAPEPPAKQRKAKRAKHAAKTVDPVAELEQAPPATEAAFQFRSQEAVAPASAISETMRPVCAQAACGVVVRAEKATLFVRVLSLIGAAFPDGTTAPIVVFELP